MLTTLDAEVQTKSMTQNQVRLLRQFVYYSIFNYPLSASELETDGKESELLEDLRHLEAQQFIQVDEDLFGIELTDELISRRKIGTEAALDIFPKALKNAHLIFNFPFVKGVYVSGSLSKGFLSEDGDIDYFIITKPGKLWIARTLLILYKKLFIRGSKSTSSFCDSGFFVEFMSSKVWLLQQFFCRLARVQY